jgi:hypothetical protein
VPLRHALVGQTVATAHEMGQGLDNGALLKTADSAFDVFITTDQNLKIQQNLTGRRLAILVRPTASCPTIQVHVADVLSAVNALQPGEYRECTS